MSKAADIQELFPVSFFSDPERIRKLARYKSIERDALSLVGYWAKNYLCSPHAQRPGKVCPFVPAAITMDRIWLGVYTDPIRELLVTEDSAVLKTIKECANRHLTMRPPPKPRDGDFYNSILLAFPYENFNDEQGPLREVRRLLKELFLQAGTMTAIFNVPLDRALHYYQATPPRCPSLPVLALRYMVRGDDVFIGHEEEWLEWYLDLYPDPER